MAVLHLENVPEELVRGIEQLAEREQQTPAEKAVGLLKEALAQHGVVVGSAPPAPARTVQEILDSLARNRFRPDPNGPDVVEMLREDRSR